MNDKIFVRYVDKILFSYLIKMNKKIWAVFKIKANSKDKLD